MKSVEQMCRDLLEAAILDGLVILDPRLDARDPQHTSAGDLTGMANLLNEFLAGKRE